MFHTLLDDPSAPVEASATAGIGYGILSAVKAGLLRPEDRAIAEAALQAIVARIGADGILADVSDGTPMGDTLDFYKRIPNIAAPYGQAMASLFLLEARRQGIFSLSAHCGSSIVCCIPGGISATKRRFPQGPDRERGACCDWA